MQWRNSATRYGHVARALHWTSVALLLTSAVLGSKLGALLSGESDPLLADGHIGIGLLLLAIMLLRFGWRLGNPNPVMSYQLHDAHKRLAISIHWFLYAAVVSQCLLGIAQVFADGAKLAIVGYVLFETKALAELATLERLNDVHAGIADLIYLAIFIHVCGALVHQVFGVVDDTEP